MLESHLPAKKRLLWRLPEFVGAVVDIGGVNVQSHTVASVSVKDDAVKSVSVRDHAFDPKITGNEHVFASSPIFNPVFTLSHGQDSDLSVGSSLPVDPCLLASIDGGQPVHSDHRSESRWGAWAAGSFPRVTGAKLDAADSHGQGAGVNSENQVNQESVGVTSAEPEGIPVWTGDKVPTNDSKPVIWVSESSNASWEALRSELMDVFRQSDFWLKDKDVQNPESGSEPMDTRMLDGALLEEANSWSCESSSGYETGSDNDEQQMTSEDVQQSAVSESENDDQQMTIKDDQQSAESNSENDEQRVIFNSDRQSAVNESENDEQQVIFNSDRQPAVNESENDEQRVIFNSDQQSAANKSENECDEQQSVRQCEKQGAAAASIRLRCKAVQTDWHSRKWEGPKLETELPNSSWSSSGANLPQLVIERQVLSEQRRLTDDRMVDVSESSAIKSDELNVLLKLVAPDIEKIAHRLLEAIKAYAYFEGASSELVTAAQTRCEEAFDWIPAEC